MAVFSLLSDPQTYNPCSREDMQVDHEFREYWMEHFERHFETVVKLAIEVYGVEAAQRAKACRDDLVAWLRAVRQDPHSLPRLDLLILDQVRQDKLIAHGIPDPFEKVKARENTACLELYPRIVAELDGHTDPREALLLAIEGIFAGNIFDLGAGATTKMFAESSPDFLAVRESVGQRRPWLVDQFESMADRVLANRYRQAMFFCDNAGSDFMLGVVPFCRWLATRGTRVIIAANRLPALNDMTIAEVHPWLERLRTLDRVLDALLKDEIISAVDSGGTCPLLDLRLVSDEANAAAKGTDLVVLEGMGRALESNYDATFEVDAIKLAMIKTEIVAARHGGKNFDTVCRFDRA